MRISVPTIPRAVLTAPPKPLISRNEAIERVSAFLAPGNATVLTGAGVSVDSGIRAYRGKDGRYMNPNYKPILYHELVDETHKGVSFRKRYWLRSYIGYPPVRDAQPNTTHFAMAALQYTSHITRLITQNVDGLHGKAISPIWSPETISKHILELHGTLHKVSCKYGHVVDRNTFQEWLGTANPRWSEFVKNLERTGRKLRTNPDGDVEIPGADYDGFIVPDCPACLQEGRQNNVHKPHLIFFGESITQQVKDDSFLNIELADRLLIVGTTLATFSAFRLLRHALELRKPILMLNVGPTRADTISPPIEKIEIASGLVMRDIVKTLSGTRADIDPVLVKFLSSGIVQPPASDRD